MGHQNGNSALSRILPGRFYNFTIRALHTCGWNAVSSMRPGDRCTLVVGIWTCISHLSGPDR